jgi:hypothetical protein
VHGAGDDDAVAVGLDHRHHGSLGGGGGGLVHGGIGDIHAGEVGDHRLELEDRLQPPLAGLRLVRRVGGEKLRAADHLRHRGRDEATVGAGPDEAVKPGQVLVLTGEGAEVFHELLFSESGGELRLAAEGGGNRGEECLLVLRPNRLQHLLAVGRRQW